MKHRALHAISWWNIYFVLVLLLALNNLISFQPLPNLLLLLALCLPLKLQLLHYLRQLICICGAIALLYAESYLPSLSAFSANAASIDDFSLSFVLDFILSSINYRYVAVIAAVSLAFLLLQDYVRFTSISIISILYLCAAPYLNALLQPLPSTTSVQSVQHANATTAPLAPNSTILGNLSQSSPATVENAAAFADEFFIYEKNRRVEFPPEFTAEHLPFDIILVNICSLSRSDLQTVNLNNHPLFADADIKFSAFNSASSYSGPATLRLLRSACGQSQFSALYLQSSECELFSHLEHLGFIPQLFMDHSGRFGKYLEDLRNYANFDAALADQKAYRSRYFSFDDEPIFADSDVFASYLHEIHMQPARRYATLFNLVALHDGNKFSDGSDRGLNHNESWHKRAQLLLDDVSSFEGKLKASGRPTLLIFVPEHGAALQGDKIQMARLRDIPSPNITNIPVYVKFFNVKTTTGSAHQPLTVDYPTSYQALAELISRTISTNYFSGETSLQALTDNLAPTFLVSENEGALVLRFQNTDFLQLKGRDFSIYPQ